jgi:AcrR family transcriptional regulator
MTVKSTPTSSGLEKRGRGRPSSRDSILDAAQNLALKQGAGSLSLDGVAKEAGVSKGGLMYNFPTKKALLLAMVDRVVEHNRAAHQAEIARLPEKPGRNLLAYVLNSTRELDTDDRLSTSLLAELVGDPELRVSTAEYFADRFKLLTSDRSVTEAAIIHLATEGLWFLELLGISPFSGPQRQQIVAKLLKLADEASAN